MTVSSVLGAALALLSVVSAGNWKSPEYPSNAFYSVPLPIPPIKAPLYSFISNQTGLPVDYYEMDIRPFTKKQYPNLPAARLIGYDGIFPGKMTLQCRIPIADID
jgi:bilirubin oxidase